MTKYRGVTGSTETPDEPDRSRPLTKELQRVEEANFAFYEAFTQRNLERMAKVWAQTPHVRCIHPGWELVSGWPDVRRSWQDIFQSIESIDIGLQDVQIEVSGRVAWVNQVVELSITTEESESFEASVVSSNIFEEVDGQWLLVLHHSSNFIEEDSDSDTGAEDEVERGGFFPPQGGGSQSLN
ncbi:MAG TPA: nuclear transport factor 2 family protein [Myxococcales bacterium LLY-WYZ-16_1]|jgi:ketosteroid isomerase-like protein|nr:nuclear transport factor 2 family protein [Myxococcales bacterium LLY-WYZ-16_1]